MSRAVLVRNALRQLGRWANGKKRERIREIVELFENNRFANIKPEKQISKINFFLELY